MAEELDKTSEKQVIRNGKGSVSLHGRGNKKLPVSDGFRHPYPFGYDPSKSALNEELYIFDGFFVPCPIEYRV